MLPLRCELQSLKKHIIPSGRYKYVVFRIDATLKRIIHTTNSTKYDIIQYFEYN